MTTTINASTTSGLVQTADNSGVLALQTANTTAVTVDASQKVGIGTSSPSSFSKLAVLGSDSTGFTGITSINSNTNTGIAGIQFASDSTYIKAAIGLLRSDPNGKGALVFYNDTNADAANWATTDEKMRIDSSGNVLVTSVAGLGYGTGSGGTVTQATSKTTSVTLNKPTGQITMNNAALAAGADATFGFSNSVIGANDLIIPQVAGGVANKQTYNVEGYPNGAGNAVIRLRNLSGGSLSEAVVISFAIIKVATS